MESPSISHVPIPVPPILYVVGWIVIYTSNQKCFLGILLLPWLWIPPCVASPFVKLLVFLHSPSVSDFLAWKAVFILSWDMFFSNYFTIDLSSSTWSPGLYHICFCPQHNYFYLRSWIYPEICSFPNFLVYLWSVEWPMVPGNQLLCCYHFVTFLLFLVCWN